MAFKNPINHGNSINKLESKIPPSLDKIIDLLLELNPVGSTPKERITQLPQERASPSQLPSAIKPEPRSAPTSAAHEVREPESTAHSIGRKRFTPTNNSLQIPHSVSLASHNYPQTQSLATLQQSVSNLEQKLQDNRTHVEEVINSVDSLLSLTVELINLQPNGSPSSIIKTISPLIDHIIERRSREDLGRMGQVLAKIIPIAIARQIATTHQSMAKALAPEIALSIQEQIRLSEQSSSSDYHSRTNDQQQPSTSTEEVKGISEELLRLFDYFLGQQRESEHKIGWIWYKLKEEFRPSPLEICWLSVVFQYSPYWAVFKTEELYGTAERTTILFQSELHKQEWLDYFQTRWGIKEEPQQRQPEGRGQQQQKTQSSGQHHLIGPTLVQPTALQLLGLTFPFTLQELKRAYRRRALATHPDSGGTAEAFSSVHHAYQTLFLSLKLLKKRRI